MVVSVISFTRGGRALSQQFLSAGHYMTFRRGRRESLQFRLSAMQSASGEKDGISEVAVLSEWVRSQFEAHHALLFIGACGIAVRSIAPLVQSKLTDPPVLVMDEKGKYVIPILSGHLGGANRLAEEIAGITGAEAVLTTATDVRGEFAVDVFAEKMGLAVQNRDGIGRISAKILRGENVTMAIQGMSAAQCRNYLECGSDKTDTIKCLDHIPEKSTDILVAETVSPESSRAALWLKPKPYILGMGCRKGKGAAELLEFVKKELELLEIDTKEVWALASIDRKMDEDGLLDLADLLGIPFLIFDERALADAGADGEIRFESSEFVEQTVGVDNVCERAAWVCGGESGEFVLRKTARDGMTMAVFRRDWRKI